MKDYRDDVIQELALSEAAWCDVNRQLVDLLADLAFENYQLHRVFRHMLILADTARLTAQEQSDAAWAALVEYHDAALRRERDAA